ncbi:M23 family metallopeptidase [Desulfococcaceae bacterium HSG8]|nr:M23 family metallopeptidase [Desulfococcaceae bacterium HSG8]
MEFFSKFTEYMVQCNRLNEKGFQEWLFLPGMLFHESEKWWGKGGFRPSPHEGVDICFYKNNSGQQITLDETAEIPVVYDGEIVKIGKDFLGKSVYIRHNNICDADGRNLYTIYGHTKPYDTIYPGTLVSEGDVIGKISDGNKRINLLSHLHISMAWIPASCPCETLDWKMLGDPGRVSLLNPLEVIRH